MRIPQSSWKTLIGFLAASANAHSWIEQLMVIAPNGSFTGSPGYSRGNVLRTSPSFSDVALTHRLPENGQSVQKSDPMCIDAQQTQNQTTGSPRLQAPAGARVALRFQENGHVTMPETQPGKPDNRGTVYIYGTTQPKDDEKFLDIHKVWNKDGTGGDKRGVLLSKQIFDDGRCYQINGGEISKNRQQKFPHEADQTMGQDLWCQQDVALPTNAPSGQPYTLYWVWDWPTLPGKDPSTPDGKQELYTTCMDVDITGSDGQGKANVQAKYDESQSLNTASIPEQFDEIYSSDPDSSADSGSGSSAGSSAAAGSSSGAASSGVSSSAAAPAPSSTPAPSASVAPSAPASSSQPMFAARPNAAATSSSPSAAQNFQSCGGPSFITRTRTVTQAV